jgi:secreted Zn-dependent insulinase-like peptidase
MLHEIKTSDDSEMTIQRVKVEIDNGTTVEEAQDEICITIIDTLTEQEYSSFITKNNAMELANKLLSIATSIKHTIKR